MVRQTLHIATVLIHIINADVFSKYSVDLINYTVT